MIKLKNIGLFTALGLGLAACGSNGDRVASVPDETTNETYTPPVLDNSNAGFAGDDILAKNSQFVELPSRFSSANATFEWQQLSGPQAIIVAGANSDTLQLLTPSDVNNGEQITFELTVDDNGNIQQDQVTVHLSRCQNGQHVIFGDCVAPGYGAPSAYIQENIPNAYRDGVHFDGQSDKHIMWNLVDIGGSRGTVIEVHFGANDPMNSLEHNGWFGITSAYEQGDEPLAAPMDLNSYAGGAIQFDIRQLDNSPAITGIGQECIWPCSGAHKFWQPTNDWQTVTVAIDDFVTSGINLATVNVPFMFREPWMNQDAHSFQLDNIRLLTDYTKPAVTLDEPPLPAVQPPEIDLLYNSDIGLSLNAVAMDYDIDRSAYLVDFSYGSGGRWLAAYFRSEPDQNSIRIPIPRDLSDYFHGTLSLHFTVEDWQGDAHQRLLLTANCGTGCQTFPPFQSEQLPVGSEWLINIPVRDLVARGLDLSNVTELFSIKPQDGTSTRAAFYLRSATLWPN